MKIFNKGKGQEVDPAAAPAVAEPGIASAARQSDAPAQRGTRARSVLAQGLFAAVVVAVAILLGWVVDGWLRQQGTVERATSGARAGAQALVDRLEDSARFYRALLTQLARQADQIAPASLETVARETVLESLVPGALRLRLLPNEHQEPDTSRIPHLSYASLELLRRAERSAEVTPLEVHQFGGAQQHVALATPIPGPDGARGVLHLALPFKQIQQALDGVDDYRGRIELRQISAGAQPLVLAANGSAARVAGPPAGEFEVGGTIWRVAYWPVTGVDRTLVRSLAVAGGAVVLVVLILLLQAQRLQRALRHDGASIIRLIDDFVGGHSTRRYPVRIKELETTFEVLAQRFRDLRTERLKSGVGNSELQPVDSGITVTESKSVAAASPRAEGGPRPAAESLAVEIPAAIFRAYDIRGHAERELDRAIVYQIGRAVGSEAYERGHQTLVVGRDGRVSSPVLAQALIDGLQASGRDVVDVGVVPTPVLYYGTQHLGHGCGVMVTGSHGGPEVNGLKVVIGGESLAGDQILGLRRRILKGALTEGGGSYEELDLVSDYLERVAEDVRLARPLKVVIDCGNGAASGIAPELFRTLGCEVDELFCELDGRFPNHPPDPSVPANLDSLAHAVVAQKADLGLAFDGDGDRLGVVDSAGHPIFSDRVLMLLAQDVLSREPGGDVVYDVKCSRHLASKILEFGGRPLMWKSGHSMIKAKVRETGALLGGEFTGHFVFAERWYGFDDALYSGARLLEILAMDARATAEVFAELPASPATPELKIPMDRGEAETVMDLLAGQAQFPGARLIMTDGLRAEFEDGWGLVRASNTSDGLTLRFEGDDDAALARIEQQFRELLVRLRPDINLPF